MIPCSMHFWWGGKPMSWLRQQTLVTFRRHHPTWEMTLHVDEKLRDQNGGRLKFSWLAKVAGLCLSVDPCPINAIAPAIVGLPWDMRSDVFRWSLLAQYGGWFSDLDVLYTSSIDKRIVVPARGSLVVTCDGGTRCAHQRDRAYAIGLVGGTADSPLTKALAAHAADRARSSGGTHQKCGTEMLADHLVPLSKKTKAKVLNLPARLLYPQGFLQAANTKLWTEDAPQLPFDDMLGLHWGGGHVASKQHEPHVTADWCRLSNNSVARAWRQAVRPTGIDA